MADNRHCEANHFDEMVILPACLIDAIHQRSVTAKNAVHYNGLLFCATALSVLANRCSPFPK
ncbi:hypothetical protein LMJ53_10855 [Rheinheimera sp. UJ51]|uniref:hypothetical protein n=1 Tax=Rheinheimera sp. UJ51 TaxID=2892446 RepID=UPI001E2E0E39|nr:hypothetical protein [Rheinheimera sp. UJ51]MCC5452220.1 hypothetical protein [Rheinheimera sp. UJ51]